MPPPIEPLARRKFTTEEFNTRLAENLLKKKKKEAPETDSDPNSEEWDRLFEESQRVRQARRGGDDTSPDMSEFEGMSTKLKDPEPGAFMKGINFLTEPLSGGYFGRKMREITDAAPPIREDYFKATGKGDIQDWLAWAEASAKGFGRGVPEGVADIADQMTSPADLAGLIAGGGAVTLGRRGIQGAQALRRLTQAAGIPNIIRGGRDVAHGTKNIFDEGLNFENAKEIAGGTMRLAGGGAQLHFPEAAIAKSKVKIPAGTSKVGEEGLHLRLPGDEAPLQDFPLRGQEPEPDFAGETSLREPGYQGRTGGLDRQRVPREYGPDRPLPPDEFSREYPGQEAPPVDELPVKAEERLANLKNTLATKLASKSGKWQPKIDIQESSLTPPAEAPPAIPETTPKVDPKTRLDELGAKSELTPAEDAEFDRLIDELHPTTAPRDNGVARFAKDESGEFDVDALYNKYQRWKRSRQKPPTVPINKPEDIAGRLAELQPKIENATANFKEINEYMRLTNYPDAPIKRFPGDEATDIGEVPGRDVDLEQAGYEAASDTAKNVTPEQNAIDLENQLYDLIGQGKGETFEFKRILKQFGDAKSSIRNPNQVQGPELPPEPGTVSPFRRFLEDEEGSFDPDFISNIKKPKKKSAFYDDEAAPFDMAPRGYGTPDMPGANTRDFGRQWKIASQEADIAGIDPSKHETPFDVVDATGEQLEKTGYYYDDDAIETPDLMSRIRDFMKDEEGSINLGDRDPFGRPTREARDKIINRKFGLTEGPVGEAARTGMRRVISAIQKAIGKEDYAALPDDDWRAKFGDIRSEQVGHDIDDAVNWLKTQGMHDIVPGQAAESQRMVELLENLKNQAKTERSTSFLERLRDTLNDESGAVPRKPKAAAKAPKAADVWANLPDNIKKLFTERGVTPKDLQGASLKEIHDTFNAIVNEAGGAEAIGLEEPSQAPIAPPATQEGIVDVSNIKFETPQSTAKLVKKTGERVPADEEARIQRLTEEAMRAADRERKILSDAGEREMTPDEIDAIRNRMAAGERSNVEDIVQNREVASRETMKPLRSRDYLKTEQIKQPQKRGGTGRAVPEWLKQFAKDEEGSIRFGPDENPMSRAGTNEFAMDLLQQNEPAMGGESPEFMPRESEAPVPEEATRSVMDMIRNFMADEEGSINFGEEAPAPPREATPGRPIPRETGPTIRLLDEEQLQPGVPVVNRPVPEQVEPSMARKTWNTAQSMMSVDLPYLTSAAFRQASPLAWTDNWFKSWSKAAESFGSKESYDALMQEIKDSKYFKPRFKPVMNQDGEILRYKELPSIAEELGVRLTDYSHLGQREENLRHSLAEYIPGYKDYLNKSNRAYTAFLNSLRKAKFEEMMDARSWTGGENDMVVGKQIAEFVNDATGRSSLKLKTPLGEISAEKNAEDLAKVLWSPRLLASRLKFLNPQTYLAADPQVRQEYLNGLFRTIGTWGAFAGLAKVGLGAEVSTDMNSSDFGKIKIGNTRIDPGSGFQQLLVFGSRMATGEFTSSSTDKKSVMGEGFKPRTRKSTAEEFAASKLHPGAKLAYDLLSASQSSPVHVGDRAIQMVLPMMAQDIAEVMEADPSLAALMAPLSSVGFGTSNYGRGDEFGKPVFTDAIDDFMGFDPRTTSLTVGGKPPRQVPRR